MLGNFPKSSIALTVFTIISAATLPAQSALLVSSGGDNSIKQYDEITGTYIRDFVTSSSGGLLDPQGLAIGINGNLFVSSSGTSSVKEYNGTTGEYIGDFVSSSSGLTGPGGLTFTDDGSLFVTTGSIPGADIGIPQVPTISSGVLQYNSTTGEFVGSITTAIAGNAVGSIRQARDVVSGGPDNTIFISQSSARQNSGDISEYDPTTGKAILRDYTLSTPSGFLNPSGLAISSNYLFYTNFSSIGRYDLVNRTIDPQFVDFNSGGLFGAVDVAIGQNGNLLVSNPSTDSIKQYDGDTGDYLGDFIASNSGGLDRPTYLTTANVPVPEPSSVLGIAALGGLFVGGALQHKANRRKQLNSF